MLEKLGKLDDGGWFSIALLHKLCAINGNADGCTASITTLIDTLQCSFSDDILEKI